MNKYIILIAIALSIYFWTFYDTKKQLLEQTTTDQLLIDLTICGTFGASYSDLLDLKKTDPEEYKNMYEFIYKGLKNDPETVGEIKKYKNYKMISIGVFIVALFFFYKIKVT